MSRKCRISHYLFADDASQDESTAGPSANQEGPQTKTNCYTYAFPEANSRFTTSNDSEQHRCVLCACDCPAGNSGTKRGADRHGDQPGRTAVVCECGAADAAEAGIREATKCDLLAGRGFLHGPEPSGDEHQPGRRGSAGSRGSGTPSRGSGAGASGDRNGIELEPGSDVAEGSHRLDAVDSDDSATVWGERRV